MRDDPELLNAILADPEDETLRLVYADWLEEQGHPRGELIRVQYDLARLPADDGRRRALGRRELQLIIEHKDAWFPLRKKFLWWECRLGFMDEVWTDAATLLSLAEALFSSQPVRHLSLTADPGLLGALASCQSLERLSTFKLRVQGVGEE